MAYESEKIKGERRLWNLYSLALEYPRNLPDFYTDEQISADLEFLASNRRLPWEIPPEFTWHGRKEHEHDD